MHKTVSYKLSQVDVKQRVRVYINEGTNFLDDGSILFD